LASSDRGAHLGARARVRAAYETQVAAGQTLNRHGFDAASL
jgi:hypothetical protein